MEIVWQLPTNKKIRGRWGIMLIVRGLGGVGSRWGVPPARIPPYIGGILGGLKGGTILRLKFFQKKSEKGVINP